MIQLAVWVALGAFIGVIASALLKTDRANQSTVINLGSSVLGAVGGGAAAWALGYGGSTFAQVLSFQTVLFAGVGAMLAVFLFNVVRDRAHHPLTAEGTPLID